MSEADPLLRVRGVSMRFGGLQALEDVSFDVMRGEILALIGPNGAGKSTLLNILSGAQVPTSGEAFFRGMRLNGLSADRVNALGLARTFQGAEILRQMTVRENVITAGVARCGSGIAAGLLGFGPAHRALASLASEADGHLETVGLATLAGSPAGTLGAGQQRGHHLGAVVAQPAEQRGLAQALGPELPRARVSQVQQVTVAQQAITHLQRQRVGPARGLAGDALVELSHCGAAPASFNHLVTLAGLVQAFTAQPVHAQFGGPGQHQ